MRHGAPGTQPTGKSLQDLEIPEDLALGLCWVGHDAWMAGALLMGSWAAGGSCQG